MLQTAPPETIEQAHAEAFEKLTPEQRQQVLAELARSAPASERTSIERVSSNDPQGVARAATRAEIRQPGIMERTLGAAPGTGPRGMGFGASLLGSFAAAFAGSMVANAFFDSLGGFDGFAATDEEAEAGAQDPSGAADAYGSTDARGAAPEGDTLAGVGDQDIDPGDFDGGGFDAGDFDV